ncbi:hypothetical protein CGLO_17199 [Colletotrichum gloeosporioides Cg-14]|uniref:Uncharacterized protein n=1 Tax=Colletotrichum gloeosporioides (strain Cg-14) TaxID=1237896 RepID=T0JLL7_COLGC|nr:hypothetical protein CGLO_17199 [Colletotrichum gloeosporioides Cg-14]
MATSSEASNANTINTAIVTIVEDMIGINISFVASLTSALPFNGSSFNAIRR